MTETQHVIVVAPDRVMRSSLALTHDILAAANSLSRRGAGKRPFSVRELSIAEAAAFEGPRDLIVVPGLGLPTEREIRAALSDGWLDGLAGALKRLATDGAYIAASCSAVFAVAQAGLLKGRRATTTWWLAPCFGALFPATKLNTRELIVEDGRVLTAGAALAHADLMLRLVERFGGYALARECRRYLVLDERRDQGPYMSLSGLIDADPALLAAERYVQTNMAEAITVGAVADAAGLGPRTFARRLNAVAGIAPISFVQGLRVARATDLARETTLSSDQIAAKVGYSDASALRRAMKKHIGKTVENLRS